MNKTPPLTSLQKEVVNRFGAYRLERPVLKSRCPKKRPPFQFEPYQLFLQKFAHPANDLFGKGLLVVHSVGSGKTCGSLSSVRNFQNNFVWVTRTTLIQDPLKDLENCAGIDPDQLKSRSFLSYKQFANAVTCDNNVGRLWYLEAGGNRRLASGAMPSARSIQRRECADPSLDPLRNKLIIVDEAHNLFDSQKANHLTPEIVQTIVDKIHASYRLSGVNSCRVLLLSATPMRKDAMTLPKLLNLLIPNEKNRLPTDKQRFLRTYIGSDGRLNRDKFCAAACGLISYLDVRGDLTRFPRREIKPAQNIAISDLQRQRYNACKQSLCHSRIARTEKAIAKKQEQLKQKQLRLRKLRRQQPQSDKITKLKGSIAGLKQDIQDKQATLETYRNTLETCVELEGTKRVYCMRRVLNFAVPLSEKEEVTNNIGRGRQSLPRNWRVDTTTTTRSNGKQGRLEKEEQTVDVELMELQELQKMGLLTIDEEEDIVATTNGFAPSAIREQMPSSSPKLVALLNELEKALKKRRKQRHMLFSDLSRFGAMVLAAGLKARGYPELRFNPQTDLRDWNREVKETREAQRPVNWELMFDFSDVRKNPKKPAFVLLTSSSLHYMGGRSLGKTRRNALIQYYNRQDQMPAEMPRINMVVLDGGFKEGIDLMETNHVWLFEPPVTRSDFEQIVGRVLRRCAHRTKPFGKQGWRVTIHTFRTVSDGTVLAREPMELLQPPAERNMIAELTGAMQEVAIDRGLFEDFMKAGEWKVPEKKKQTMLCTNQELKALSKEQLQSVAKALNLATGGSHNKLCIRIANYMQTEKCGVVGEFRRRKGRPYWICDRIVHLRDPYWLKCQSLSKDARRLKCPKDCRQYDTKEECDRMAADCLWSKRNRGFCANRVSSSPQQQQKQKKKSWTATVVEALQALGGEATKTELQDYIEKHIPERATGGSWKSNLGRILLHHSRKQQILVKTADKKYKLQQQRQ